MAYYRRKVELETVKVVQNALHNEAAPHMKELFLKLSDNQSKELRNSSTDLYTPRLRTSIGQKSFGYRGLHFWNSLVDKAKETRKSFAFNRIFLQKNKTINLITGHFHNYLD